MSITQITDENNSHLQEKPGIQLAAIREKKGLSREYVAGKLHLRVNVIELLEADDYKRLPDPVFIIGYFRAYANLLAFDPAPFIQSFNNHYVIERKPERALWQSKRESHKGELLVRWVTGLFALSAVIAVTIWWQKNKETQVFFGMKTAQNEHIKAEPLPEVNLTDLSKMQSMFSSAPLDEAAHDG